jgi:hypothetical protein
MSSSCSDGGAFAHNHALASVPLWYIAGGLVAMLNTTELGKFPKKKSQQLV